MRGIQVAGKGDIDPAARFADIVARVGREGLTDDVADIESWLPDVTDPKLRAEMAKLLGFYWLRRQDFERSLHWSDAAAQSLPDDPDRAYNAIFACCQMRRWDETIARTLQALNRFGRRFEYFDILAATFGITSRLAEAQDAGTRALELKSRLAPAPARDLSAIPVPAFDAAAPTRNVIAFSLFGADPKYTDGAILNARATPFLYPGWTARFYVDDSVPPPVIAALGRERAQVMVVSGGMPRDPFGPLWRFLAADGEGVDRYILRDADSLINTRERLAVDEWLRSGRHFHLMRDHYDHCELVLAGMWGGVRAALPPMVPAILDWSRRQSQVLGKTTDQEFLRTRLWPTIRHSVLAHDSQFAFGDTQPFPILGDMPPGCWVGCQWRQHAQPPMV